MIKREFIPGESWLYFKLYCGFSSADRILIDLYPLCSDLTDKGIIEKWFFIRYSDPDFHIRVRFLVVQEENYGFVLKKVNSVLAKFLEIGSISKVMLDTYSREVERYSVVFMESSEDVFYADSVAYLQLLNNISSDSSKEKLRYLFAFKSIDNYLTNFKYSDSEKLAICEKMRLAYWEEFGINKTTKKFLDDKYRIFAADIQQIMESCISFPKGIIISDTIQNRTELMNPAIYNILENNKTSNVNIESLITSYIHMSINRTFLTRQRQHELVIYDFLWRYYRSVIARSK